jgi:HD-like signal output (HDOD) protein
MRSPSARSLDCHVGWQGRNRPLKPPTVATAPRRYLEEDESLDVTGWLSKLFSGREEPPAPHDRRAQPSGSSPVPDSTPPPRSVAAGVPLSADQLTFLEGLIDPPHSRHLDELPGEDRWFIGGIQKRWHARQLELPVLSQAAIRLTTLLRSEHAPTAQYVELVESDSALTVEVLRSANSALFAASQPARSLEDAIRRIGLSRLGSVLIMAQLKKKVLGGAVADKAALLMDLVPPLGVVASHLAKSERGDKHIAFMRGSLLHVEHMVILGAVADVSRDRKQPVRPTVQALLQACRQFGPEIRHAVATAWNLEHVLLGAGDEVELANEYCGFRTAILSRWLDRPLPELPDVAPARLMAALANVSPRVAAAPTEDAHRNQRAHLKAVPRHS